MYYTFFTKPPKGASSDQIFYSRLHYGFVLEEQRQITKAKKHYVQTLEEFKKAKAAETPETKLVVGVEVAAQIMFKQAKKQIDTYMDMSISGPSGKTSRSQTDKILIKQLSDKAKALTEVEKTFVEIISTGAGEWGLASLVDLGKAYQNMSSSLTNSYFPPYLTDEQVEIYKMGLEDKAYVQDEKAVQAYTQALAKSYELNLYNDYTAFAIRALGELRPDEYPTVDEKIIDPRFTTRTVVEQTYEEQP